MIRLGNIKKLGLTNKQIREQAEKAGYREEKLLSFEMVFYNEQNKNVVGIRLDGEAIGY